jgi:pectinesterase inhibitor-like protein
MALSLRLLLLLLLAMAAGSRASGTVEDTCAKATAGGKHADLAPFCVSSLNAVPGSAGADARGLASIATNLTLANYTGAVAAVKALQLRGGLSPADRAALATCRTRYIEALNVVHSAVHALAVLRVHDYVVDMRYVQGAAVDCNGAFRAGGTRESPMRKVNQDAIDLTTVAMLIVTLLK